MDFSDYESFLASKKIYAKPAGFTVTRSDLLPTLKPFQADVVSYLLSIGRGAAFEECGLGKTLQQLEWAYHVATHTGGVVLILCPLAVSQQTLREADRFGIARGRMPVSVVTSHDQIPFTNGIAITNYEKLAKFYPERFAGVVLDESSILKSYNGKTKQALCRSFAATPYRLACTATPSPNDLMELGNHSEFLGAMDSSEMLARWFINDTAHVGKYRLRGHAEQDYWRWVASWAVSLATPGDLGYDDSGYVLPEMTIHEHVVASDDEPEKGSGLLFSNETINATTLHREKKKSVKERAELVAGLVNNSTDSWVVWCDTDYEADWLNHFMKADDVVEVRGSHSEFAKERNIVRFSTGDARVIISKPSMCGFGLNWQHCHKAAFVGLSYSFEMFYQAVRRIWRFGQQFPVDVHVVNSESEQVIWRAVMRKESSHRGLQSKMSAAMRNMQMEAVRGVRKLQSYDPGQRMQLPEFLRSRA